MNSPSTVLLVDDDQDDLMLLLDALKTIDNSINYLEKFDGREAIQYLNYAKQRRSFPCLVVLDINMPVIDGREVLAYIKADEALKDIPVVVFTTSSNTRDIEYCLSYGVPLVTKPMFLTDLQDIARHLLSYCSVPSEKTT